MGRFRMHKTPLWWNRQYTPPAAAFIVNSQPPRRINWRKVILWSLVWVLVAASLHGVAVVAAHPHIVAAVKKVKSAAPKVAATVAAKTAPAINRAIIAPVIHHAPIMIQHTATHAATVSRAVHAHTVALTHAARHHATRHTRHVARHAVHRARHAHKHLKRVVL